MFIGEARSSKVVVDDFAVEQVAHARPRRKPVFGQLAILRNPGTGLVRAEGGAMASGTGRWFGGGTDIHIGQSDSIMPPIKAMLASPDLPSRVGIGSNEAMGVAEIHEL
jgi:hypothetical protein